MPRTKGRRLGYTFKEAAAALDVSQNVLWNAYRDGHLEAFKFGSNIPMLKPAELLRIRKFLEGADVAVDAHELIRQTIEAERLAAERLAAEQSTADGAGESEPA